jgi:hypothetical protein
MPKKKETPEEKLGKIKHSLAIKRTKLGVDNVARVLDNMNNGPEFKNDEINAGRRECIVCTEVDHCAWDCKKILGPMFQKSWIVTHSKIDGRVAREIIDLFQKRRALSTELGVPDTDDAESSAAESSRVGGSTAAVSIEDHAGTVEGAANPEEPAKTLSTSDEASEEVTEDKKTKALMAANLRMTSPPNMTEEVEAQYPMRKGSCGAIPGAKKTHMTTNFYKVDVDPQTIFYEYTILDLPVGHNRRKLKAMVDRMIKHVSILSTNQQFFATDETSTIISWKQLHNTVDSEGIVGNYDVPDGKRRDGSDMTRPLRLKYQRTIDFAELNKYVDGKQDQPSLWQSSVEANALNILVSKSLDLKNVIRLSANKFFVVGQAQQLGGCGSLRTMQGYFYTVKPLQGGILLNVNFGTSAFYTEQTVGEFLADTTTFRDEYQKRAALSALRVRIEYGRGKTSEDRERDMNDNKVERLSLTVDENNGVERVRVPVVENKGLEAVPVPVDDNSWVEGVRHHTNLSRMRIRCTVPGPDMFIVETQRESREGFRDERSGKGPCVRYIQIANQSLVLQNF